MNKPIKGMRFGLHRERFLQGFSLTELLVVVAIMAMLVTASVVSLSSLSSNGQITRTAAEISGLLEQARQYAVAQHTYVWVAFYRDSDSLSGGEGLRMAIIVSGDGTDSLNWSGTTQVPRATDQPLDLLTKIRTYPQIQYCRAATITVSDIPTLPAVALNETSNSPSNKMEFNIRIPTKATSVIFSQVIQFTPSGEARNGNDPVEVLEFGLKPVKSGTVLDKNETVVRINGLTGQTIVYR